MTGQKLGMAGMRRKQTEEGGGTPVALKKVALKLPIALKR